MIRQLVVALAALCALVACDKDKQMPGAPADEGGDPRARVVAAWKAGGLEPSPLTAATVAVGTDCQSGTVGAIDVLVCVYPTAEEATAAEDAGLAWVGQATGAAQATGTVLVAMADRRKRDPSGRTINQLMKLAK